MDPTMIYKAIAKNDIAFFNQIMSNLQSPEDILKPITDNEDSILHVATKFKRENFAKIFISLNEFLINKKNKKGDTPLHVAASIGCWGITKILIDCSSSSSSILETVNIDKDTALHVAVRNDQHSVVELLIQHNQGLAKMVNEVGESALFLAVERNNYHTAKYILDVVPESINCGGRDHMNVLHVAIIRMGAKRKENLRTAFMRRFAAWLRNWVSFSLPDASSSPPASRILPITMKDYNVADFLLEVIQKKPNLASEADAFGWTPLHYAAYYGREQVMELLLQYAGSSEFHKKDKEGLSALHIAAERGHLKIVKKVVSKFPSTYELLDNRGRTPLHVAAESGKSFSMLLYLFSTVPDDLINKQDNRGNTLLHMAVVHARFRILAGLASDRRVDRGAINKEGLSCLEILKPRIMAVPSSEDVIFSLEGLGFLPSLQAAFPGRTIKVQTTGTSEPQIESRKTSKQEENDSSINGKTEQGADGSFIKEKANVNLLVATFVATVTFAAIFTMPYKQDGATSGQNLAFGAFAIANSISFVLSAASMFLHFLAFGRKGEAPDAFSGFLTYSGQLVPWAVYALVVAYSTGSYGVLAHYSPKIASLAFGFGLIFFIGPLFAFIRLVWWASK